MCSYLPGRTDDAVRNRFLRLCKRAESAPSASVPGETTLEIKEEQKKGDMWTAEEDALIVQGVQEHEFKWQRIAMDLPGRSANAVRNRWLRGGLNPHGVRATTGPHTRALLTRPHSVRRAR